MPLLTVLQAVADPVRLSLLRQLAAAEPAELACGTFDLPIRKSGLSHHFTVLRQAGLLLQHDDGSRRLNRLRRAEFDEQFPGLLDLVLADRPLTEPPADELPPVDAAVTGT
ncbi:ArsR/SmtB family transcription factor [Kitasatospora sp. NPDC057965]|uniref:ArsR/SmtB family transcription factor n=1 Tax=unclassified Kitasatospora TaxID=2633591 RepID=UPI003682434F